MDKPIASVLVSKGGIIAGFRDGTVKCFDSSLRYQNFSIEFKNGECRGKVACTSDHNLIVLEFYKEIRIYNRKEKNESVAFRSEENKELFGVFGIYQMEISKDDKMLYLLGSFVENKNNIWTLMVYSFETKQKNIASKDEFRLFF